MTFKIYVEDESDVEEVKEAVEINTIEDLKKLNETYSASHLRIYFTRNYLDPQIVIN